MFDFTKDDERWIDEYLKSLKTKPASKLDKPTSSQITSYSPIAIYKTAYEK